MSDAGEIHNGEKIEAITIALNLETAHAVFADLVQVETNPEWVILSFIQKLPTYGQPPSPDQPGAKLLGRYAITWPHFARLTQLLIRLYEQHKASAKEVFEAALSASFVAVEQKPGD